MASSGAFPRCRPARVPGCVEHPVSSSERDCEESRRKRGRAEARPGTRPRAASPWGGDGSAVQHELRDTGSDATARTGRSGRMDDLASAIGHASRVHSRAHLIQPDLPKPARTSCRDRTDACGWTRRAAPAVPTGAISCRPPHMSGLRPPFFFSGFSAISPSVRRSRPAAGANPGTARDNRSARTRNRRGRVLRD